MVSTLKQFIVLCIKKIALGMSSAEMLQFGFLKAGKMFRAILVEKWNWSKIRYKTQGVLTFKLKSKKEQL